MTVPASGILYFGKIAKELEHDNYWGWSSFPQPVGLEEMSTGNYSNNTINTSVNAAHRPDQNAPHAVDEFYQYDHDFVGNTGGGGA